MLVYLITNTVNGKYYVGQTVRPMRQRWLQHVRALRHESSHLYNAIAKYGAHSFVVEELARATTRAGLDELETMFIILLAANNPTVGYNEKLGGQGSAGYTHTPATRQRMSGPRPSIKGRKQTPEHIASRAAARRGHSPSAATRAQVSASLTGRKSGPDSRKGFAVTGKARQAALARWANA